MKLHFIDYPEFVDQRKYYSSIMSMVNKLIVHKEIISILQIGNVNDPGISDIDLVVVFSDKKKILMNPLRNSGKLDQYLLVHGLFGTSRSHFVEAQKYTIFTNYKKLWGEDIDIQNRIQSSKDLEKMKRQIAAEYLLKIFIKLVIERTYGLSKLRSLLLESNAIGIDLDILKIKSGKLFELIEEIKNIRQKWFYKNNLNIEMNRWHEEFYIALNNYLNEYFTEQPLRFAQETPIQFGRNIKLKIGDMLATNHSGIVFPPLLALFIGRRYYNILHRFNRFSVKVPSIYLKDGDDSIAKRFIYQDECRRYNQRFLPYFAPLVTGLGI